MSEDSIGDSEIPSAISGQIRRLCRAGYQQYDAGEWRKALRCFYRAWLLLPKPQHRWEQAGWILTAIGDTYFQLADYRSACEALLSALHCPRIEANPFTHQRLAQSLRQLGQIAEADEHFRIAAKAQDQARSNLDPLFRDG